MLELAILGLLTDQELHGYELKKRLTETLGARGGASFGSLYPALARLERAGAVKAVEARSAAPPVPQTGSLGGEMAAYKARLTATRGTRGKKVYGITATGRQLFEELLTAESGTGEDERHFALRLIFARHLHPDARIGLLERRRLQLQDHLARLRTRVRAGVDRLDIYGRSLAEHDRDATEHDLTWIEQLIARERAAAAGASDHPSPGGAAPLPATPGPATAAPPAPEFPPAPAPNRADRPSLSGLQAAAAQAHDQEDTHP